MLKITDLSRDFDKIKAVKNLSLQVNKGEIFGLLGPNGAGKSTTINMIVGLLKPSSGKILIQGSHKPHSIEAKKQIGFIPQDLAVYENLTARENLTFFATLHGLKGKKLKEKVDWALEFSQLEEKSNMRVITFSGGMKRRLNIAAALMHNPSLLLMDEPTVGVDTQSRNAIFQSILSLKESGLTIIYTTHYMEEAERLCDRIAIIDNGELKAVDTVEGLKNRYCDGVIIGIEDKNGTRKIRSKNPVDTIVKANSSQTILRLTVENPTLEEVFLNLTGRKLRE
jgi:linearmycin/streptolysin S transport system ATP-binding protein